MCNHKFKDVNPKQSFPALEEEMLKFWEENKIFEKSITSREGNENFEFYDGPPFATGTPHYGHILAGTLKDVVPRYQTMKGKKVERKFGWDTHGLPIENIVEKKLEISGKEDIEKIGVHAFNETCRENVLVYTNEWEKTVKRMGRWVDMENAYKTMDRDFMESVWWVYKSLYDKGLIYEGYRVVPYCPRCSTPLSNFEVNQGYKDIQDKTITAKFKVKGNESKYILAWTTTPWTLMSNLGLAVGSDIDYVELLDKESNETYVIAKDRIGAYYKNEEDYEIVREYKGDCLAGIEYEPLFGDFKALDEAGQMPQGMELGVNAYKVVIGHHVTTESGTGIVHIAPAYGEDDYQIGKDQKLGFVSHISDSGKTEHMLDGNGVEVFDYNEKAIQILKDMNAHVKIDTYMHSYPHCWRCDNKLIYRAISAWYVAVEQIKDKMVANNQKINWVPGMIKNGRFGTWVENARDWNISRNRYWGSAIPVWQSEDKSEEVCIGGVDELYEKNKDYGQITKVILMRHGRTDYNDKGLMDYKNNANLSELGKAQAEELMEAYKDVEIDVIYSSPLTRCHDTAKPLADAKGLEIQSIDGFKELQSPDIQDKEFSCKNYKWENGYGGGELVKDAYERVKVAFEKVIEENKGKTIVICSHGDPLVLMRKVMQDYDYDTEKAENEFNNREDAPRVGKNGHSFTHYVFTETKKEVDIHKHFVDEIFVKSESGNKLKRIPEVLDCWFESGSMPYASKHYPYENADNFKFPAEFIAEGLDQTRGWFYTLLILGTALFDQTPFLNVIVNGIILAEDGQKMSKSKKNYPDPQIIFDNYGADAMRFYLMNSPVVEAQDFRFAESGVEEVVKKVILPLWNTYYFFTTYANLDGYKKEEGDVYFVRHGQTYNNVNSIVNGGDDDQDINEEGIKQAHKAGQNLPQDVKFDAIITSGMTRANHTAEIIKSYMDYDAPIIEDEGFKEQLFGELKGMKHADIMEKYGLKTHDELQQKYRYNGTEDIPEFTERVQKAYADTKAKYQGKNVLIVTHGGTFRCINMEINNLELEEAFFKVKAAKNSVVYKLPKNSKSNELDKWIISELNELIKEVEEGFESYKLQDATRPIVKFMDNLTNWYIRRSRKRFWKSENDGDKVEAYETLHEVLVELSKVIAPFMPFVSEYIYKNLTGKESVHLDAFPNYVPGYIFGDLNEKMNKTQQIINLGLASRVKSKIRVRQPLKSVTIGENLEEYYLDIIKEELNVKDVKVVDSSTIAKKICKPNGRMIGPKFGKDVKLIMSEAKAGNFEELDNGNVKVQDFILEDGEFEIAFEKGDDSLNIEAGFGMVIAIDDEITEELKREGYARDLVRFIQEARKEADYSIDDRIKVSVNGLDGIDEFKGYIENETLSKFEDFSDADLTKDIEIEDIKVTISIKK